LRVIYNAVPTDKLTYHLQIKSPPYLAFLGRLNSDKGIDTAIEVSQKTGIPLKIAGTINQEEKGAIDFFNRKVKPYLRQNCEWIGAINDTQKSEFLGGALATLFPIRWSEPFGIVMAESLACGTPVIATPMGSVPEVIKHGKTGFICDSVEEMVQAVHNIQQIDRAACRLEAENRFSADAFLNQVLELYRELL
jgi:glycosyltransferase involved in cell wall biosynthesis